MIHWLLRTGTILERWSDLVVPLERHVAAAKDDLASYLALAGVYLRADGPEEARDACSWIEKRDPDFKGQAESPPLLQAPCNSTSARVRISPEERPTRISKRPGSGSHFPC